MKKRLLLIPLLPVLGVVAWYSYQGYARWAADQVVVLPEFKDLPPGPRAPDPSGLGVVVGRSTLTEVWAYAEAHHLHCKDTSARALMKEMRAKKKAERAEQEAKGTPPVDAVSKASSGKKSPMEQNPQVRLSCEETESAQLDDRPRAPAKGRVLFIFDSPEHPLRHVSYRRLHKDLAAAYLDAAETYRAVEARFGAPLEATRPFPSPPEDGDLSAAVPGYEPFNYRWGWADLSVAVTLNNYQKRGVDVYEAVEVPWPIRADAPALPKDYVAPPPKVATGPATE